VASRSHSDTPHSVGLLWTSDQPDAETSTWQHTTLTSDKHPCPRRNSNPQFQQASGRKPTPWTALPLELAYIVLQHLNVMWCFTYALCKTHTRNGKWGMS
jgi:hypothetical protein